eukprot:3699314-Amphidinium_carterae.1
MDSAMSHMTTVDTNPTFTLDLATGPLHAARGAQRGHCHPLAMDSGTVRTGVACKRPLASWGGAASAVVCQLRRHLAEQGSTV